MPATLQTPGETLPLDDTMGVMFLGTFISAILYGASVVQTVYYFIHYSSDRPLLRYLVMATVIFDTAHLACVGHTIYHYLITHYYERDTLNHLVWSVIVEAVFNGFVGGLVQVFFAWRVFLMTGRNKPFTILLLILIVATAGCGIAWTIIALQMDTYEELLSLTPLTISINVLTCIVDVLIAGSLIWTLRQTQSDFKQTQVVISRLIIFFINTGLATSLCAIASMIALAVRPDTLVYAFFYFCIGRLYCNSLLASLNSRKGLRASSGRSAEGHNMVSFPGPSNVGNPPNATALEAGKDPRSVNAAQAISFTARSVSDLRDAKPPI